MEGLDDVESYIDDVVVHMKTWKEHKLALGRLFQRIQQCGLTVRPTKCSIGCREIDFLGQRLGGGKLMPQREKIEKVLEIQRP